MGKKVITGRLSLRLTASKNYNHELFLTVTKLIYEAVIYFFSYIFFLQNILPSFPRPKFVKIPDSSENQKTNDANFTPKEYFRCPVLEHNVEKIDISLKWNDQVCIVLSPY